MKKSELVYPELSYKIYGILFATHNEVGPYRNERQYGDVIERYLKEYGIPYEREKAVPPPFKGERSGRNKLDFIVDNKIVLELKAKRNFQKEDYYQAMRYLTAFNKKLCIMVNFRNKYLKPKRILNPRYH